MESQIVIARRIARELKSGMLVNLGIGIPTLVANYLPEGMRVFFQSENGPIGTGPPPVEGMAHRTLSDAAGRPVTALPGASAFDSAMSFGLIRRRASRRHSARRPRGRSIRASRQLDDSRQDGAVGPWMW
jgi:acetate CoA/acetoacetate CoA-transferase beta subunit